MNEDSSTANQDDKPSFATENDLDFVMSEEREQEFINETLGLTTPTKESTNDSGSTDTSTNGEPAKEDSSTDTTDTGTAEETKDTTDTETKPTVTEEKPSTPEVPLAVKTDDLWLEVEKTITDEDGNTKTEKIKLVYDPEDPTTFIPEDFTFKNDKQLADILEAKAEMASLYKERKNEIDSKLKEVEEVKTSEQKQQEQLASWDAEIQDLIDNGVLTAPKAKPEDKNFLEDESVKQIDAVFKFMAAQNEERSKSGKAPIVSFGTAFTLYQKDANEKAQADAEKKEQADAKKKAALIGGSSASGAAEQRTYRPGSYSSIYDVPVDLQLIFQANCDMFVKTALQLITEGLF